MTSARDGQGFGPPLRMWEHVLISAAGPAAGFLLAAAVCGAVYLSGHGLRCEFGLPSGFMVGPAEVVGTPLLTVFIAYILFASVAWGLLNLLPVYPLDGGQIAREVLLAAPRPRRDAAIAAAVAVDGRGAGGRRAGLRARLFPGLVLRRPGLSELCAVAGRRRRRRTVVRLVYSSTGSVGSRGLARRRAARPPTNAWQMASR